MIAPSIAVPPPGVRSRPRAGRAGLAAALGLAVAACGASDPAPIGFGDPGPLVGAAGRGGFRFGVATAATQIEDANPHTDWYVWTQPIADGGLGKGTFVGDAVRGYTRVDDDVAALAALGVDSYRFSIEWARVEPVKDQLDEAALAHYRAELVALRARGLRPVVTLHHFANPVWVADPRAIGCAGGPTDANLCGLGSAGGPAIVAQMAEHAALIARRFGDLVDDWGTVNEPMNYLLAAYATGTFPPGKLALADVLGGLVPAVRDYLEAHAAMYRAIHANDTIDADGDGVAAAVGLSLSVADWRASRDHQPSTDPVDLAARERLIYLFHYLFVDAIRSGRFDADLDGTAEEPHPAWAGTLDWLGLQYYFRAGVTGATSLIAAAHLTPCFGGFDSGACLVAPDPTYCVPRMGYEGWIDGLADVLIAFAARYPELPLVVSEGGIATDVGARRADHLVRSLEAIARARDHGVDVRGYFHWSLTDNFEWAEGYGPHFGLYAIDRTTFARTPTAGADALGAIARARAVSSALRVAHGGTGPLTPDPVFDGDPLCGKQPAP